MTYSVMPVSAAWVKAIWPSVLPLIQRGVDGGRGDRAAGDYLAVCADGSAQLWLIGRDREVVAICIAEVCVYPQRRVALVDLMAGDDLMGWLPTLEAEVERWARFMGCSAIQAAGRPGFARQSKNLGYRAIGVVLEKDLLHA